MQTSLRILEKIMIKAGIIGATGYTGSELLRLLAGHPLAAISAVTSRNEQGKPVTALFPGLRGHVDLAFSAPDNPVLKKCDVVFFATPNGTAMSAVKTYLRSGIKVIDLSADFRLKDARLWAKWYGQPHASPKLLGQAVYGLPELNRKQIIKSALVANPGCYPTAIILALLPLIEANVVDAQSLIADAKSGISGAGRNTSLEHLYAETSESFKAYGVTGHRHLPEMCQALNSLGKAAVKLTFVPHLAPMVRGIHATVYARLKQKTDIQKLFTTRYKKEPFVDVMPAGSHPETRSVRGSNYCRLAVHQPGGGETIVILSVIDNLVKGAAGQAVQNMNLMFGLDETTGLEAVPLSP
jgi:N-acetyl-gamma-glutamyl-phosphate reductase